MLLAWYAYHVLHPLYRWQRVPRLTLPLPLILTLTLTTTDGDEYCGVLNAAENCVLDRNAGWVCA